MRCWSGLLVLLVWLTACGPEPTPFPVAIPATSTAAPTAAPITAAAASAPTGRIRYALAGNTAGFVADLPLLEQSAQVQQLTTPVNPADLGTHYDLIAAYGDLPGGARSPVERQVALILNPAISPLNNAEVVNVLRQAITPHDVLLALNLTGAAAQPQPTVALSALRVALANAGWPDGFDLNLIYTDVPGALPISDQLRAIGIVAQLNRAADPVAALESGAHLALVALASPDEQADWEARVGTANIIPLYTLPISYLAVEGLTITFTPAGWPLVRH